MFSKSVQGPHTGDIDSAEMLHDIMKYIPYNRRTLTAMRCVSKPFRSAVQSPKSPWSGQKEVFLSHFGQFALFNAQEDEQGLSSFELYSVSPIGRKFRTPSAKLLSRNHALIANGLTKLVLHHSQVDNNFFEPLGALENLRELELASCRSITSVGDAKRVKGLRRLAVAFCPLESDGVAGLLLPSLEVLALRCCQNLSNLNSIAAETAASLQELYVESCNVYDDTADIFFSKFSEKLHTLHLTGTHLDSTLTLIPEVTREKGLRSLDLTSTPVSFETLQEIAPSLRHTLEYLSLENCTQLRSFEPVGRLEALRFLDVSKTTTTTATEFMTKCALLELFRMSGSHIESIMFLHQNMHLRVLDAPGSDIIDYSLMYLEDSPFLDTVVLSECMRVTNVNVLRTCPNIRRIYCARTSLSDEGISLLGECANLEELDIKMTLVKDCNNLSGCPALKMVNVCGAVESREGIQALLDRPEVEVLCDLTEDDNRDDDMQMGYCNY